MYFQYERLEEEPLTREMIDGQEEVETLLDWHFDQKEIERDIVAQLSAYREAEVAPPVKMVRKLGFVRTALKMLERRVVEEGGTIEVTEIDPDSAKEMQRLRSQVASQSNQLTAQAEALRARNATIKELRAQLRETGEMGA
jgi:hypothetical protein